MTRKTRSSLPTTPNRAVTHHPLEQALICSPRKHRGLPTTGILGKGGGLSTSAETVYAFKGTIADLAPGAAGAITISRFIAAINLGAAAGDIPPELVSASAYQTFPLDNVKYNGSLDRTNLAVFATRVRTISNRISDDITAFPLTGTSLFAGE